MKDQTISLKDLMDLFKNKDKYEISRAEGHQGIPDGDDGNQGEYNESFIFYKHPGLPENVFMRETYNTNSYGYDERIETIDFVTGKEKTITIFEPI